MIVIPLRVLILAPIPYFNGHLTRASDFRVDNFLRNLKRAEGNESSFTFD